MSDETTIKKTKGADEKFCGECGEVIKAKAEICPKCGVRQLAPPSMAIMGAKKSKVAAGLLGIFFGGIGLHKFYLGQNLLGVIYILFCWTFIPAIVGFCEGIIYLLNSEESFQKTWGNL